MRALKLLFFCSLTLHALPTLAGEFDNSRSLSAKAPADAGTVVSYTRLNQQVGCETNLSSHSDLQNINISVADPIRDSVAVAKLLNFKLNSAQLSAFTRMAQTAFEISLANGGNVSISASIRHGQVEPTILIRVDLQPEELNGVYRLSYSSGEVELNSQIMVPRIEIRIEPERIVIFQARAPAEKKGNALVTTETTSHGNAFIVAYPGSKAPVIESGIVPSRMVFNSETLFGRHCLEIAKVAALNMSSDGLIYLRAMDGYYVLSGEGWLPMMSAKPSPRRLGVR